MKFTRAFLFLTFLLSMPGRSEDFAELCAGRAAIERVYFQHRLGRTATFEEALPRETLQKLVREDLRKEAALQNTYGVAITVAMLDEEVQRINTTTRAPEMLSEIKKALDHNPTRFANIFAKPILVERLLRQKFDDDDTLHASQRRAMECVRARLTNAAALFRGSPGCETPIEGAAVAKLLSILKENSLGEVTAITWQLGPRPAETGAEREDEEARRFYFPDLPPQLQQILCGQLHHAGDVSAVIELAGRFQLYLATDKTPATLSVATLSIPKRSYEQWLHE